MAWSTVQNFSSNIVWSPRKIWLLFLILCARMQRVARNSWHAGIPTSSGVSDPRSKPLFHVLPCRIWSLCQTVSRGPQNLGDAGPRSLWWDVNDVPPHNRYHAKFGRSRLNNWCAVMEIRKSLTLRVPPFKVIQGHWNRHGTIGYLWLPISVL